jgi:hypothetical protein
MGNLLQLRPFTELPKPGRIRASSTLGDDGRDAILAAREIADIHNYVNIFHTIHCIAHGRNALLCGCCLHELYPGYTSRSEAWGFGYFILCDGCFIYFFGKSVYDFRLELLRQDRRELRR